MISPEKIKEIISAIDIVQFISKYIALKKAGRNFVGLCPFHNEKTPSFSVSPDKQIFHCFGCHAGGDALGFLMKIENIPFIDGISRLAEVSGISLPSFEKEEWSTAQKTKKTVEKAALDATNYMQRALNENIQAISYLISRGLDEKTVKEHKIGFLPKDGWGLLKAVKDHESLALLGLAAKTGRGFAPRMNGRIIFPISDDQGRIIAFGGRALGDERPKYINSPENQYFKKGQILYNFERSRAFIIRERKAIIVEGYMDYLLLYQGGIKEVLATLGTAMTEYHLKRLRPLVDKLYLVFDGDNAGQKAAEKAGNLAEEIGVNIRIIALPKGQDPADYIREQGASNFEKLQEEAVSFMDFMVQGFAGRALDLKGRVQAANEAASFLKAIKDPIIRGEYRKKISEKIGVPEGELNRRIIASPMAKPTALTSPKTNVKKGANYGKKTLDGIEQSILKLILISPAWIERVKNEFKPQDFPHSWMGELLKSLSREITFEQILAKLPDEEVTGMVRGFAFDNELEDELKAERALRDSITRLYSRRSKRILAALRIAESNGEIERVKELQEKLAQLKRGME